MKSSQSECITHSTMSTLDMGQVKNNQPEESIHTENKYNMTMRIRNLALISIEIQPLTERHKH